MAEYGKNYKCRGIEAVDVWDGPGESRYAWGTIDVEGGRGGRCIEKNGCRDMAEETLDEERNRGHGCRGTGKAVVERWLQGRENPGREVGLQLKSNDPTPDGWETNARANIWSMPAAIRSTPQSRSH